MKAYAVRLFIDVESLIKQTWKPFFIWYGVTCNLARQLEAQQAAVSFEALYMHIISTSGDQPS